jgi:hypothetical protein
LTKKYDNPYDVPIDPKEAAAREDEESHYRDEEAKKKQLEETVEGEYDYTG